MEMHNLLPERWRMMFLLIIRIKKTTKLLTWWPLSLSESSSVLIIT